MRPQKQTANIRPEGKLATNGEKGDVKWQTKLRGQKPPRLLRKSCETDEPARHQRRLLVVHYHKCPVNPRQSAVKSKPPGLHSFCRREQAQRSGWVALEIASPSEYSK